MFNYGYYFYDRDLCNDEWAQERGYEDYDDYLQQLEDDKANAIVDARLEGKLEL